MAVFSSSESENCEESVKNFISSSNQSFIEQNSIEKHSEEEEEIEYVHFSTKDKSKRTEKEDKIYNAKNNKKDKKKKKEDEKKKKVYKNYGKKNENFNSSIIFNY